MRIFLFNRLADATHVFFSTSCAAPGRFFRLGAGPLARQSALLPQPCGGPGRAPGRAPAARLHPLWGGLLIGCLAQATPAPAQSVAPGLGTDFGLGATLATGLASAQSLHADMIASFGRGSAPVVLTGGALSLNGRALQEWQGTIASLYNLSAGAGTPTGTGSYAVRGAVVPHGTMSINITPTLGGGAGASAIAYLAAPRADGTQAIIDTRSFAPETPAGNRIEMHAFSPTAEGGIFVAMALDGDTRSTTALGVVYDRQGVALTGVGNPDQTRVTTRSQERTRDRARGLRLGLRRDSAHGWAAVGWVSEGWSGASWQQAGWQESSLRQEDWAQEGWTVTPRIGVGHATSDSRRLQETSYGIVSAPSLATARTAALPEVTLSRSERLRSRLASVSLGALAQRDIGNGWSLSIGMDIGRGRMQAQLQGHDGVGIGSLAARGTTDPEQTYRAMTWLGNVSLGLSHRIDKNTQIGFEVFADRITRVPEVVTRATGSGGTVTGGATDVGFSGAGEQNFTRTFASGSQSGLGVGISFVHRF